MKGACSISYSKSKEAVIAKYPRFQKYFDDVEEAILKNPLASNEEIIFYDGKPRHMRKRAVKTTFFSGLLPDVYKYLTVTYGITKTGQIIFIFASLHDYIG